MQTNIAPLSSTLNASSGIFPADALKSQPMPEENFLGLLSSASGNPSALDESPSVEVTAPSNEFPHSASATIGLKKNPAPEKKVSQQAASIMLILGPLPTSVPVSLPIQDPLPTPSNPGSLKDANAAKIQNGEELSAVKNVRIAAVADGFAKTDRLPAINLRRGLGEPVTTGHTPQFPEGSNQEIISDIDGLANRGGTQKISGNISNATQEFSDQENLQNNPSIHPDLQNNLMPSLSINDFAEGALAVNPPNTDSIILPDEVALSSITTPVSQEILLEPKAVSAANDGSSHHPSTTAIFPPAQPGLAILNPAALAGTPASSMLSKLSTTRKSNPNSAHAAVFRNSVQKITAKIENNQGSDSSSGVDGNTTINANPTHHRESETDDTKQTTTEASYPGNGVAVHDSNNKDSNNKDATSSVLANAVAAASVSLHPAVPAHTASSVDAINPPLTVPHIDTDVSEPATGTQSAAPAVAPAIQDVPVPENSGNIQVAHIADKAGQAEMHIGIRMPVFGSVEVHTSVHQNQVGVVVGSERGDLKTFLNAEIPTLRESLNQQDLQFSNVRFLKTGNHTGGFLGDSGAHSGSQQPPHKSNAPWVGFHPEATTSEEIFVNSQTGLSIHA